MLKTSIPVEYQDVLGEVVRAYADCTMEWEAGSKIRNLSFRASKAIPAEIAANIMEIAVPDGYNAFEASLLRKIKGQVVIAREGSVCVYVQGVRSIPKLQEDERSRVNAGWTRLWWD